jgi:predicted ATPase
VVAKGQLPPSRLKLHWFKRDVKGATTIETADIDKNGAFGDWPEDFGEVELVTEQTYLDEVMQRGEN